MFYLYGYLSRVSSRVSGAKRFPENLPTDQV